MTKKSERSKTHGQPSWIQHAGKDPAAARAFYEKVLGWTISELPMKDGSMYPAIMGNEGPVGGFASGDGGWITFITVDDVDDRVHKAKSAGAAIVAPAMTAPGVGRMATIADPFGGRIAFIDYSKA